MHWSHEEKEALKSAWAEGGDIGEIARRMNRSTAAIAFQLATLGIWDVATRDRFLEEQHRAMTRERQAGWAAARAEARRRDGNACRCCGSKAALAVHHIIEWTETRRHDLQNLITLCGSCHAAIHGGTCEHHAGFWAAMLRAMEEVATEPFGVVFCGCAGTIRKRADAEAEVGAALVWPRVAFLDGRVVGERLRAARVAANLTQKQIASWASLTRPHVSILEGSARPACSQVEIVAGLLHLRLPDLIADARVDVPAAGYLRDGSLVIARPAELVVDHVALRIDERGCLHRPGERLRWSGARPGAPA
jgi:transcriptional regulator with XRE-family HTH domain